MISLPRLGSRCEGVPTFSLAHRGRMLVCPPHSEVLKSDTQLMSIVARTRTHPFGTLAAAITSAKPNRAQMAVDRILWKVTEW